MTQLQRRFNLTRAQAYECWHVGDDFSEVRNIGHVRASSHHRRSVDDYIMEEYWVPVTVEGVINDRLERYTFVRYHYDDSSETFNKVLDKNNGTSLTQKVYNMFF